MKTDLPEMKLHPAHVVLTDTEALGVIWLTTRGSCFSPLPGMGSKMTAEQRGWILETMQEIEAETT